MQDDIEVVGEAADGEQAVRLARELRPDLVLMDIRMPEADGLEATRRITADPGLVDVRILILTTFEVDEYVFEALSVGASGFVVKDTEPADLVRGVRSIVGSDKRLEVLTEREREREVMALVAGGLSNEEIAGRLFLSPLTAKTHMSRAVVELGARDRARLVVFAHESGLIHPGRR